MSVVVMDDRIRNAAVLDELPLVLTRADVARLARCAVRTVERAQARGQLLALPRRGGGSSRVLYDRRDVIRWLGLDYREVAS